MILLLPTLVPTCIDCRRRADDPVPVAEHPDGWILSVCGSCLITGRYIPLAQRPNLGNGEPLCYPPEHFMPERLVRRLSALGPRPDLRPLIEQVVTTYSLTALEGTALLMPAELAEVWRQVHAAVAELRAATRGELHAVPAAEAGR
ncbi:hypothetical protein [Streptomyces sp. SBT349]|uniref:hypothetical protein n=1 Tax=Streptomyces sp. SBT349 TaxID=1580539 RepID=UPI00066DC86E|nr:hypothetical protein [Streptomyces sp. SBT349]